MVESRTIDQREETKDTIEQRWAVAIHLRKYLQRTVDLCHDLRGRLDARHPIMEIV